MLTEAIIQTSTPTSLKIDGADQDDLLILESISGLSVVKNSLYLGEFAREGGYYQGRRRDQLNPVLNFRIQPDYANDVQASDIRETLYDMFLEPQRNSDQVRIDLVDSRKPTRLVMGYTETIEADIFSKEMRAQVSLLTTDNYLRSVDEIIESNITGGWFEKPIDYQGSAETGIKMAIDILGDSPTITIQGDEETMVLEGPWTATDTLYVETMEGFRTIKKNGYEELGAMTAPSRWITLKKGINNLAFYGEYPGDGKAALLNYGYRAKWWGI